jgi:hypothetical protein
MTIRGRVKVLASIVDSRHVMPWMPQERLSYGFERRSRGSGSVTIVVVEELWVALASGTG